MQQACVLASGLRRYGPESARNSLRQEIRVGQRGQFHQPSAVLETWRELSCHLEREARLTCAARARQRHHTALGLENEIANSSGVALTSDERRPPCRQVGRLLVHDYAPQPWAD